MFIKKPCRKNLQQGFFFKTHFSFTSQTQKYPLFLRDFLPKEITWTKTKL